MQSYPSPGAVAADSGAPFFSSNNTPGQQQTSQRNSDDLQMTAQLTTGLTPVINVTTGGPMSDVQVQRGQGQVDVNQQYKNEQDHHAHLQPSPSSLDQIGGHYGNIDGSLAPRKRSKVSRACDECRRKKIRCDASGNQSEEYCTNCKRVGARCQFSRIPMKRGPSKGYIKELADRLHTLEGAMHSGEIVPQYLPSTERRGSEDFSPSLSTENMSRKRRFSTTAEFGAYLTQRPLASWDTPSQDAPRNLPQTSSDLASPQTASAVAHMFRETNYSPNGLQTAIWRNEPEQPRQSSSSYDDLDHDQASPKKEIQWDHGTLDAYYNIIHTTYSILPHSKNKTIAQLLSCPVPLGEAIHEAISGAVNSFSKNNSTSSDITNIRRSARYTLLSSLEDAPSRPLWLNIIYLQTMLLLAIEVENNALCHPKAQSGHSRSVWISNTIGLAYSIKLFLYKPDRLKDMDPDTDEKVARRIWWSLFVMDRWNSASTSSPALIPDTASVLYPDDLPLLGDVLWNLARLSTILGHISTINTVSNTLPPLSVPLASAYGATVKGELERVRESLLSTYCQPLVLMAYWHLRILVELQLVDSEPNDLVEIAASAVDHIAQNPDFVSPLRNHFIFLIILALIDLLDYDMTRSQSESQLNFIIEKPLITTEWQTVVRTMINRRKLQTCTSSNNPLPTENEHHVDIENLVRLADLATAAGASRELPVMSSGSIEDKPNSSPFRYYGHLREQVRNGFLCAFAAETSEG